MKTDIENNIDYWDDEEFKEMCEIYKSTLEKTAAYSEIDPEFNEMEINR